MRRAAFIVISIMSVACGSNADVADEGNAPYGIVVSRQAQTIGNAAQERRRIEVDEWQAERSAGWSIIDTRITPSGQVIDYVAADTVIPGDPDAPFASPPFEVHPRSFGDNPDAPQPAQSEMELDPSLQPPPGTVAVVRPTFSVYIEGGDEYANLDAFITHLSTPANETSGASPRLYGQHTSALANLDTYGYINLWKPNDLVQGVDLSLMQTAEYCGGGTDTAEAGLQVQYQMWNDFNMHLFAYFTTTGYAGPPRDYVNGYTPTVVKGFVPWTGATTAIGAAYTQVSVLNGTQRECLIELTRGSDGNWWMYACGSWVGYFPTNNSTTMAFAQRIFYVSGLDTAGCGFNWYGEVFSHTSGLWGPVDMGSGKYAADGFRKAAYIAEPSYSTNLSTWNPMPNNPYRSTAANSGYDAHCYTVSDMVAIAPGLATGFFLGGPGYTGTNGCL